MAELPDQATATACAVDYNAAGAQPGSSGSDGVAVTRCELVRAFLGEFSVV